MTPTEKQAHHIKWLKFAILLSQTNFEELTEGQKLDLKNDYRRFLRSMDQPQDALLNLLKGVGWSVDGGFSSSEESPAPESITKILGEDDVDELCAKSILEGELLNLASQNNVYQFRNGPTSLAISRLGDSFDFTAMPQKADHRIFALLGHHLAGSKISASMLRRCPTCQKIFLANQKPRADRQLHCSTRCSGNAASKTYQLRKKQLPRAMKLLKQGASIDKIVKLTGLDRSWLDQKLNDQPHRRKIIKQQRKASRSRVDRASKSRG